MTDLNLDLDFFDHPKCARLSGLLGRDSEVFPLRLWCYVGRYHSVDGKLAGYSPEAIEQIVRWRGQPGKCVEALTAVEFLEEMEGGFKVHDWCQHQGHIHALKTRNKKVARNRWKKLKSDAVTVDTSGIPKNTSGVPQPTILTDLKKSKESKPPEKPPAPPVPVDAPRNGDGTETPKIAPKAKPLTNVQRVVLGFKAVLGVETDDKGWDSVYFRRYSRPALDLLRLFEDDVGRVADCIDQVSGALERRGLSWTPETIVKHAGDWKNGRLFK